MRHLPSPLEVAPKQGDREKHDSKSKPADNLGAKILAESGGRGLGRHAEEGKERPEALSCAKIAQLASSSPRHANKLPPK